MDPYNYLLLSSSEKQTRKQKEGSREESLAANFEF
jgi:hypothetical protein